jgi:hypothetical protein
MMTGTPAATQPSRKPGAAWGVILERRSPASIILIEGNSVEEVLDDRKAKLETNRAC